MAKNEPQKQEPTTAEQLAAQLAAEQKAVTDKQLELDDAASFKTLVKSGGPGLEKIREGWKQVLAGIKELDELVKEQALAVQYATEYATANGTQSKAIVLGHEPLVAHSMLNMSSLPWPAVLRPMFYVAQYPDKDSLWMNIILTLNQGTPVVTAASGEAVARAMLSGIRDHELQGKSPEVVQEKANAQNWFGFKPKAA